MVYGARLIATLWVVFWTWFALTSSLGKEGSPANILLQVAVPGPFFALILFLAWKTEALAGLLLFLMGVFIAVAFPFTSGHLPVNALVFVVLTLALPPLAAGTMFLIDWRMRKPRIARLAG
jgi:hypothetical protein